MNAPVLSLATYQPFDYSRYLLMQVKDAWQLPGETVKKVTAVALAILLFLPAILFDLILSAVSLIYRSARPAAPLPPDPPARPVVQVLPPQAPARHREPLPERPQVDMGDERWRALRNQANQQELALRNAIVDMRHQIGVIRGDGPVAEPVLDLNPLPALPALHVARPNAAPGVLTEERIAHALHLFGAWIPERRPEMGADGIVNAREYLKSAVEEAFQFLSEERGRGYRALLHADFEAEGQVRQIEVKDWMAECSFVHYLVKSGRGILDVPAYLERFNVKAAPHLFSLEELMNQFQNMNREQQAKLVLQTLTPQTNWHQDEPTQQFYQQQIKALGHILADDPNFMAIAREAFPIR